MDIRESLSGTACNRLPAVNARYMLAFQEYSVIPNKEGVRVIKNEEKLPWTVYVGAAGMPGRFSCLLPETRPLRLAYEGQTAYYGWKEYAAPQKGDTVFVTAAGGTSY